QRNVLYKNRHLKSLFESSKILFDKPITISQISFEKKQAVENHVLMIGDTAGLIHPLCGNGMAMAMHSAKIASDLIEQFCKGKIQSRNELEEKYIKEWDLNFKDRIHFGRMLAKMMQMPKLSGILLQVFIQFPLL